MFNGGRYRFWGRGIIPRETKQHGIHSDFQTPSLQYWFAAIPVHLLRMLIAISWIPLMPPIIPWLIGMSLAFLVPIVVFAYILRLLLRWTQADTADRNLGIALFFILAIVTPCSGLLTYFKFWDWWEAVCYSGFFGVPTPHLEGLIWLTSLGICFFVLSIPFTLWKPSRWTFGISLLGIVAAVIGLYISPLDFYFTKGATNTLSGGDVIFYGTWAVLTVAIWWPSFPFIFRMHTEMADDNPFDEPVPVPPSEQPVRREHSVVPFNAPAQTDGEEPYVGPVVNSKRPLRSGREKRTRLRMDEFVEGLWRAQEHGFARHKFTLRCSGRTISQHNQWRELYYPLSTVGIIEFKQGGVQIHSDFRVGDSIIAIECLEALGLEEYAGLLPPDAQVQKIHDIEENQNGDYADNGDDS